MKINLRSHRRLAVALSAVGLASLAIGSAANAAVPSTGTWYGESVPEFRSLPVTGDLYKPKLVISVLNGHVVGLVGTVRVECTDPLTVADVKLIKTWRAARGPKVSGTGSFGFRVNNAWIHGTLSRSRAVGAMSLSQGDSCAGQSRFNIPRGRY